MVSLSAQPYKDYRHGNCYSRCIHYPILILSLTLSKEAKEEETHMRLHRDRRQGSRTLRPISAADHLRRLQAKQQEWTPEHPFYHRDRELRYGPLPWWIRLWGWICGILHI